MENREQQILSEIKAMMASVRSQLELLDAKMAELQQAVGQEDEEMVPIDLELDDIQYDAPAEMPVDEPVEIPVEDSAEDESDDDLPFYDLPAEPVEEPVEEAVEEVAEEPADLPAEEPVVQDDDDDLPIFAEPDPEPVAVPEEPVVEQKARPAVIDSMIDRQAWRTDMPGTQVKDIRSAISLNDRILFINMLFNQDPMAFQEALTKINQMTTLDEAVSYIVAERPDWDLGSETVYRFMMAVRRKIR
ncbi:MAG: hypothetical protein IJV84_00455 [Bacteroidales bacterium]|nr:hypothetical protein [Bacteroidales bacterium]